MCNNSASAEKKKSNTKNEYLRNAFSTNLGEFDWKSFVLLYKTIYLKKMRFFFKSTTKSIQWKYVWELFCLLHWIVINWKRKFKYEWKPQFFNWKQSKHLIIIESIFCSLKHSGSKRNIHISDVHSIDYYELRIKRPLYNSILIREWRFQRAIQCSNNNFSEEDFELPIKFSDSCMYLTEQIVLWTHIAEL